MFKTVTPKKSAPKGAAQTFSAGGKKAPVAAPKKGSLFAALAYDSDDSDEYAPAAAAAGPLCPPAPLKRARQTLGDQEEPIIPLRDILAADPVFQEMMRGDVPWGDLLMRDWVMPPPRANKEADLWAQPFAAHLDEHVSFHYNTTDLTDAEYRAFMTWLYENGWNVLQEYREYVHAVDDDAPPRVWVSPEEAERLAAIRLAVVVEEKPAFRSFAPLSAPGTDNGRRTGAPVPRFCREAHACKTPGCRYVHGDTIAKVNRPCCPPHGGECSKKATCLFMHPGETFEAGACIHRSN
jgi:hypothetical protein